MLILFNKSSCLTLVNNLVQPCSINYMEYPGRVRAIITHKQWNGMVWLLMIVFLLKHLSTRNPALVKNILCVFVSPHHLRRLLVCVLCSEVLQDLFVVAAVDVVAIDLKDDLARLKARPHRLPACSVSTWDQRSKVTVWFYSGTVYNTLGDYNNTNSWKSHGKTGGKSVLSCPR